METADLLIKNNANINGQDLSGNSALMGVSYKGYDAIARLLLKNGAVADLQNGNGMTALMFSIMFGRMEVTKNSAGVRSMFNN